MFLFPTFGIFPSPPVYQEYAFPQNTSFRCLDHKTLLHQIRHHTLYGSKRQSSLLHHLSICLADVCLVLQQKQHQPHFRLLHHCSNFLQCSKILNITIFLNKTSQKYNIINIFPNIVNNINQQASNRIRPRPHPLPHQGGIIMNEVSKILRTFVV